MPDNHNAQEHTEIKVSLGKIETKIDSIDGTLTSINEHLCIQNGRLGKTELTTAVQGEKIDTCEDDISMNTSTIKANTWKIALLVGGIVGVEKVGSWLLG